MDEARRVIERLERIEAMRASSVPAGELIDELRNLLEDGTAWLASEGEHGTAGAVAALDRLARTLPRGAGGLEPGEVITGAPERA